MEEDVGLKESFGSGGGVIVGNLHEDSGREADLFTSGDNEAGVLNKLNGTPLGVGRDGLRETVRSDS
jgi:hypothetical protein